MIKVVNLVSVIIAPIVVQYSGGASLGVWAVALVLLGILTWAVIRSKAPAPSMTTVPQTVASPVSIAASTGVKNTKRKNKK